MKQWMELSAASPLLAQPGAAGTALRWISAGATRARRLLCQHCRVFARRTAAVGKDSWQGLCRRWGDGGGVWELGILAVDVGRVTPISTVGSWSRPCNPCKETLNTGLSSDTKSQLHLLRSRSTIPALVSHLIFFKTSM